MSVQVEKSNSHCSLAEAEEKLAKSQPIVKAKKPKKLKCKELGLGFFRYLGVYTVWGSNKQNSSSLSKTSFSQATKN